MTNPTIVSPVKMEYGLNFSISGLNISEEIRDSTANDIGQNLGTLGRNMGNCTYITQTLRRHRAGIKQKFGRHLAPYQKTESTQTQTQVIIVTECIFQNT